MNNSVIIPSLTVKGCHKNRRFRINTALSLIALLFFLLLTGCSQNFGARPGAIPRTATVILPTKAPTVQPSPVSTRVMPVEVLTPAPSPTITPIPDETRGLVVDVIDGDTIVVVMDGDPLSRVYQVRYLGIDAPVNSSVNPWGVVAYETNRKLTNLKVVRLVRDETDFDAEGYLLRYVYADNQLLSLVLAEQGLAEAAGEQPNTQFETEIQQAEERAKSRKLGLWSDALPTPTSPPRTATEPEAEATAAEPPATPTVSLTATLQITSTVTLTLTPQTVTVTPPVTPTVESTVEPTAESTSDGELRGP